MPEARSRRRSMILVTEGSAVRLEDALASGADIVCVDFEDTVDDKPAAHALYLAARQRPFAGELAVRLNPMTTEEGLRDLLLLAAQPQAPDMLVMTMVTDPAEVRLAAGILPGVAIMVIVETPEGLARAAELAVAAPAVEALWLGGKDLSLGLGCDRVRGLDYARGRTVQAAAAAGLRVFDDIYRPFDDRPGLEAACAAGRERGLHAKVTLHAGQVAWINNALN